MRTGVVSLNINVRSNTAVNSGNHLPSIATLNSQGISMRYC
jgi:hypothetical protein